VSYDLADVQVFSELRHWSRRRRRKWLRQQRRKVQRLIVPEAEKPPSANALNLIVPIEPQLNGKDAIGAKLQALRSAAAAPHSDLLRPVGDPEDTDHRSHFDYISKVTATLTVIEQVIRRGVHPLRPSRLGTRLFLRAAALGIVPPAY